MKKTILILTFLLLSSTYLFADEVILHNGQKYTGVLLANTEEEVALQIDSDWKVFSKYEVKEVITWDEKRNEKLRSKWKRTSFFARLKEAVKGGPSGIVKFIKPYHFKIMRWTSETRLYKFLLRAPFLKEYKEKNKTGFTLSIYCVLLILLAVIIKLIKEGILLVMSIFGWTTDK